MLDHSTLSHEMFKALNLQQKDFAASPSEFPAPRRENEMGATELMYLWLSLKVPLSAIKSIRSLAERV